MRIEAGAAFKAYQTTAQQGKDHAAAAKTEKQAQAGKTDTLSISERGLQERAIQKQAQTMSAEVEAFGADARLARLAAEVRGGGYRVSADALAEAMLGAEA